MMARLLLAHLTLALAVALGLCLPARAQTAAPAAPAACPPASATTDVQLYGLWRAEFEGGAPPATLLLEKHPEYEGGLRGGVNRDGVKGLVAGDLDKGELSLDESADGISIAATWSGVVQENSCGKEIRGTWAHADGKPEYGFVLRKVPGW